MNADFKLLIDGRMVAGAATMGVVNPATGRVFARCARADGALLERAVAAARHAFPLWAAAPIGRRREWLLTIGAELASRAEEFAVLLTSEQGKPLIHAHREVADTVAVFRAFAAMDLPDQVLRDDDQDRILRQRVPLGVVAAITPWNYPLLLLAMKLAPALLAGNTVVAKPAPTTPLTTLLFAQKCLIALPAGVINVIVDDNDLGDLLTMHPDVAKIAFTGSTATGRQIMANAALTVKRVGLELGGNDPAVVLDDVDVPRVAAQIFAGAMENSGQICFAIKRVYVPDNLYEAVCAELAMIANNTVVGNGLDAASEMGPLQNFTQFSRVLELIADARANGCIIAGGSQLPRDGYFIPPTIFRNISDHARLVTEEQFGPVLPVLRYADVSDAVARANKSIHGLGASVWGRDVARAFDVAQQLMAGMVWINKHLDFPPGVATSGAKQSGFGAKMGQAGLEEFVQMRIINQAK